MSARDAEPATIPPPDGEDDAYNATTKVGAMPPEVMAKLRAEGLLPAEVEEVAPRHRPAKALEARAPKALESDGEMPSFYSSVPPDHDEAAPLPELPAPPLAFEPAGVHANARPGERAITDRPSERITPALGFTAAPALLETPVAFPSPVAFPPPRMPSRPPGVLSSAPAGHRSGIPAQAPAAYSQPPETPSRPPAAPSMPVAEAQPLVRSPETDAALQRELKAFGGARLSKASVWLLLVGALAALVALLFLFAMLSQRK